MKSRLGTFLSHGPQRLGSSSGKGQTQPWSTSTFSVSFPTMGELTPAILGTCFLMLWFRWSSTFHGATMKHVNRGEFLATTIPLPPLDEQKRIAGILDAADALRGKGREAIAQLDTLLQSTFLDMFGDPVTNPKEWEKRELSHLCRFRSGYAWKAKSFNSDGIGNPVIRIQNVSTGSSELIHTTQETN